MLTRIDASQGAIRFILRAIHSNVFLKVILLRVASMSVMRPGTRGSAAVNPNSRNLPSGNCTNGGRTTAEGERSGDGMAS